MSAADVAALVLRDLGVPVAEADRPDALPPVSLTAVAAAAIRRAGIGQTSSLGGIVGQDEIARRALRSVGVNPADIVAGLSGGGISDAGGIALRALQKLGVIAADETPSTPDLSAGEQAATTVHEMLVKADIATWVVTQIPDAAADYYTLLTANMLAPTFGRAGSIETHQAALEELRRQALTGVIAQTRAMDKVAAVQAEMADQGWVDWVVSAIPLAAAESYVTMVTQLLAPTYGKPFDAVLYGSAQMQVRRIALAGSLGQTVAQEKVRSVHEGLNAQGLISWPVTAIPAAYADDYAAMAATKIAAFLGMSTDPNSREADTATWNAAQEHICKGAMIAGMQERALAKVQAAHAELTSMGVASWTIDAIPAAMADAYAAAAVAMMTAESGKGADAETLQAAYARIRLIAMNGPAGQALAEQKVRAVHYGLEAQGRVTWTLANIPLFVEEPYVQMTCALLAPELGQKPDLEMAMMGDRALRLAVVMPATRRPVTAEYF